MDTEVDVPNPSLILIPGMYAEVNLTLDSRPRALVVPVQAVDAGENDSTGQVAVVTSGNRIDLRSVRLGLQTTNGVEIRSGLKEGEMVVVGSRASLKAGQEVEPKITFASGKPASSGK